MTTKTNTKAKTAEKATAPAVDKPQVGDVVEMTPAEKMRAEAAAADKAEAAAQVDRPQSAAVEEEFESAPTFLVDITKDPMMKPVLRVFEHEIAILEELHGADNIHVRETTERELPITGSAEAEYSRLETRYGRNGLAALRKTYPSVNELASATGLSVEGARRRSRSSRTKDNAQSAQRGKQSE